MKHSKFSFAMLLIISILIYLTTVACSCGGFPIPYLGNGECDESSGNIGKPIDVSLNDIEKSRDGSYIAVNDNGEIYGAFFSEHGQLSVSLLYTVPGNPALSDIEYISSNSINIIVGSAGTILRNTSDNLEWVKIESPVSEDLNKIYVQSAEAIYIVGNASTILKSGDLGLTWQPLTLLLNPEIKNNLYDVNGIQNTVFVSGDNYSFYKSTDGGETWGWTGLGKRSSTKSESGYNKIYFYDDSLGYVGGPYGLVLKTTDGGNYWSPQYIDNFSEINDLFFISPEMGGVVGTNGTIRFTTDGGENWFEDSSATSYIGGREIKRVVPFGKNYGTVLGAGGLTTFIAPDSTYLDSLVITPTAVEKNNLTIKEFKLYQNYPNPFNPTTNIRYSLSSKRFVSIKIYDILGNELATLVNEEKQPGTYNVEFNSVDMNGSRQRLSSGVYFYKIIAGNFSETKKLVLLK